MHRPFALPVAFLLLVGCGNPMGSPVTSKTVCQDHTTTAVHLPNGESGGVVCCADKVNCYQQSAKVCNSYYVTQANDAKVSDFTSQDQPVEYVIQCYTNPPPK